MRKRIVESLLTFLDWCWPFPVGILAAGLAFSISAGTWLALHRTDSPRLRPPRAYTSPTTNTRAVETDVPSPIQSAAPPVSDLPVSHGDRAAGSLVGESSGVGTISKREPTSRFPMPEPAKPLPARSTLQEIASAGKASAVPTQAQTPKAQSKPAPSAPASQLSPAQEAALNDKLTLGGFLMDRQDYPAAISEFQAALAIDPTNREAQTGIQQAREASKKLDPSPQP